MMRVGLTGGIGSGKSTVSQLFRQLAVPVIDSDEIAHQLLEPSQACYREILAAFGPTIRAMDGSIDRGELRKLIFRDSKAKERLEAILHPAIRAEILERCRRTEFPYAILVIPLLYEVGWESLVDRVLVIDLPVELQRQRAIGRDGDQEGRIEAIMASQLSREERLQRADDIIDNSKGAASLDPQVERLHHYYLHLAAAPPFRGCDKGL